MQWWKKCFSDTWCVCEMLRCESLSRVSASSFSFVQSPTTHALPPARAAAPSRSELDGAAGQCPASVKCFYFELFLKKSTQKKMSVHLMQPKHNERLFFFPQIILDGDSSILRASEKTFFPLLHIFCLCDCVRRERCRGTTWPYTKLFSNYIENKFQLKCDLLLLRGLRGKSCAAASFQESFKDD